MPVPDLEELYREYATLATVRRRGGTNPSADDLERAAAATGLPIPAGLAEFWRRFPDRHPPFWDVLRLGATPPAGGSPFDADDIVHVNRDRRAAFPDALGRCLLFFNTGWGGYDCFVFDGANRLLGIGTWDGMEGPRGEPPEVSFPGWEEWFAGQMVNLRS
jgi:hypothetical protein